MRIHSLLVPKCRAQSSPISGSGVFASEPFVAGELVAVWGGTVYTAEECRRLASTLPHFETHTIGICKGYFLGSNNLYEFDDAELFNHSCDPNIGVRGQIVMISRRAISQGEELTFDYETVDTNPGGFSCNCGSGQCRRTIDGSAWRELEFQRKHVGYFSCYIQDLIAESNQL